MMDDQEILKLMKVPGRKKRSQSCFIPSSSIIKDTNKLNQILHGENTIVYALVEVSNDSNKSAKTEKIPLNNKDFLKIMQKFMTSQKFKSGRNMFKPSKRKQVTESDSNTVNISKEEKNNQNNVLTSQVMESPDESRLGQRRSNHSSIDSGKVKGKDDINRNLHSADHKNSETESHHVKILFNRSNLRSHEKKIEEERVRLITRGTNTDIFQTPDILEKALQRLTFNLEVDRSNSNLNDKQNFGVNAFNHGEDFSKSISPTTGKYHFLPFIITNNQVSDYHKLHSLILTEPKNDTLKTNEFKAERLAISNDDPKQICLTDNRTDQMVKSEREVEEKEGIRNKANQHNIGGDEVCLLKEVKLLQQRINAIVELLETNNYACSHKFVNNKNVNDLFLNEMINTREPYDRTKQYGMKKNLNHPEKSKNCLDCGIQAMIMKSCSDKTVAVPSRTIIKSYKNRLVQAPSEEIIKSLIRPKRLGLCKSASFLKNKIEGHFVKIRRVSSEQSFSKSVEDSEFLYKKNNNLNCEGSTPKNCFPSSKLELIKKKFNPQRAEKSTNIIFRKNRMAFLSDNEKEKSFRQSKMVEKIKIIGNTTLFTENRNSGIGTIKLELNELGSIKISNKISRKTKRIDNNSFSENTVNNSTDSSSKIIYNNAINGIKLEENYKKLTGKETVSKIATRETPQKKAEVGKITENNPKSSDKDTNSPQSITKLSKFKKSSMPVRMFFKTKEGKLDSTKSSKLQSPKNQRVVMNADENHLVKSPRSVRSAEKISEIKNIIPLTTKNRYPKQGLSSQSDKNQEGIFDESEIEKSSELSGKSDSEASSAKKTPAVKAIWALTKIILYEDGSQSFEVLEASSNPLQYQSNKVCQNNDNNNSNIIRKTHNYKNSSYLEEKSH